MPDEETRTDVRDRLCRLDNHPVSTDLDAARDGRNLVIANALDTGPVGYIVVTDIDTKETTQVFCPADVPQSAPYASLLAESGMFYTAQGRVFLECDPAAGEWAFHGIPSPSGSAYLSFTEGPNGTVWAGSVYQTGLVSFDPATRQLRDHGRLDPEEQYLMHLAVDDLGWVYGGIGTARGSIVAYDPRTGEKRALIRDEDRIHETAVVHPTTDGAVYGRAAGQSYRLYGGGAAPIAASAAAPRRPVGNIYWGQRSGAFPDGRRVRAYNLPERWLEVEDRGTGEVRRITLDHEAGGVVVTSLGAGPEGMVYGSTAHPMHFLALDTNERSLADYGPIPEVGGGNFCAIAHQGAIVIGAEYWHGRIWVYDVHQPWDTAAENPRYVAEWPEDIGRPRTALAHPDGRHVLMAGYAGYGLCAGGIGIHNLETGEDALLTAEEDLLPGHSPITLQALPGGDLVGGTSVDAPGGGRSTATEGELFILDWKGKDVVFRTVPVPGDRNVTSVLVADEGMVYGLSSNAAFFAFDPAQRRIAPGGTAHEVLAEPPAAITAGGALVNGHLCYASGAHVWSLELPPRSRLLLPKLERNGSGLDGGGPDAPN